MIRYCHLEFFLCLCMFVHIRLIDKIILSTITLLILQNSVVLGSTCMRIPKTSRVPSLHFSPLTYNVNADIFTWDNFRVFRASVFFAKNSSHGKIKPMCTCLYEGNRSSIVNITQTRNVLLTFSRNFPSAKITTFTVL